jgi:hypothetical protein
MGRAMNSGLIDERRRGYKYTLASLAWAALTIRPTVAMAGRGLPKGRAR